MHRSGADKAKIIQGTTLGAPKKSRTSTQQHSELDQAEWLSSGCKRWEWMVIIVHSMFNL